MAVAKLKQPPADPLRTALAAAIEAAAEAREALDRHKQAITKTRTAKWSAEKVHEVAVAGVDKAIAEHAENIAANSGNADADDVAPSSSLIRMSSLADVDVSRRGRKLPGCLRAAASGLATLASGRGPGCC